jgi:ribosomal protein L37AE/L43A
VSARANARRPVRVHLALFAQSSLSHTRSCHIWALSLDLCRDLRCMRYAQVRWWPRRTVVHRTVSVLGLDSDCVPICRRSEVSRANIGMWLCPRTSRMAKFGPCAVMNPRVFRLSYPLTFPYPHVSTPESTCSRESRSSHWSPERPPLRRSPAPSQPYVLYTC